MEQTLKDSQAPYYLIGLLILVCFFTLFRLSDFPLQDGVESRNGVNAVEMMQTGKAFVLQYGGEQDMWHAKPPLTIWLTTISFHLFGFHVFALRFVMALATILSFLFLFKIIRLYQAADFAFFTCLILLTVKGLVGRHIQDLGEYDAWLVCFMMMATYCYLQYHDFKKKNYLVWAVVCYGLAFFTKGVGVLAFVPGLLLYLLFRGTFRKELTKPAVWTTALTLLAFPILWMAGLGDQAFSVLLRNFNQEILTFTTQSTYHPFLFFDYLNLQFAWWNYTFFIAIPVGVWIIFSNKKELQTTQKGEKIPQLQTTSIRKRVFTIAELLNHPTLRPDVKLLLFSVCMWVSLAIVCTLSQNEQYLAFSLPFIAITIAAVFYYLNQQYDFAKWGFIGLLGLTTWLQLEDYIQPANHPPIIVNNADFIRNTPGFACDIDPPSQDIFLYLKLLSPEMALIDGESAFEDAVFCRVEHLDKYPSHRVVSEDGTYAILVKNMQ